MIELGKVQNLEIVKVNQFGAYLNLKDKSNPEDVLLPRKQVPEDVEAGDFIEVFVYRDTRDHLIATSRFPKITLGDLEVLRVVETTNIGAFLDWGLEKDLFLPFREQIGKVKKGGSYLVALYVDDSDRLCATMNIYNMLSTDSSFKENDKVNGTVYSISRDHGALVAVGNKYEGLIPNKELFSNVNVGDKLEVRIKRVRQDGKLELSLRNEAYNEIEGDSQKLMKLLNDNGGTLPFNDRSSPEDIKRKLNMSKAAFKRAVGRLLKEGAIEITEKGIKKTW